MFQHENGMPILSWYDDKNDTKLFELVKPLRQMAYVHDVRQVLISCTS